MRAVIKNKNIEVEVREFRTVSNGHVPCVICECKILDPHYQGISLEPILAEQLEVVL